MIHCWQHSEAEFIVAGSSPTRRDNIVLSSCLEATNMFRPQLHIHVPTEFMQIIIWGAITFGVPTNELKREDGLYTSNTSCIQHWQFQGRSEFGGRLCRWHSHKWMLRQLSLSLSYISGPHTACRRAFYVSSRVFMQTSIALLRRKQSISWIREDKAWKRGS